MPKRTDAYTVPFEVPELSFDEAVALAADTGRISGDAGPLLETVVDMLDELGRPDEHYDCLQIAGTNGKTSTTRFTAAILAGEGLRCALYTSPQLVRYPERMEIDGRVVSDAAFAHGVSAAVEAGRRVNATRTAAGQRAYTITPFDLLTVAAFVVFAESRVDVAVLEVGMGGRWDATSAADPVAVAITGIGLDHMRILGDTLGEIAAEKAAVIKPGRIVVLGEGTHEPEVQRVMDERCEACGVTPLVVTHEVRALPRHVGDILTFATATERTTYEVRFPKPELSASKRCLRHTSGRGVSRPPAEPRLAPAQLGDLPHARAVRYRAASAPLYSSMPATTLRAARTSSVRSMRSTRTSRSDRCCSSRRFPIRTCPASCARSSRRSRASR